MRSPAYSALLFALSFAPLALADEPPATPEFRLPNLESTTLGGKQLWCDELHFHRWRIQRHAITDHCRLIDGENRRHAWGTFESCQSRLTEIKREQQLPPMKGKAVVVVHGLFAWSDLMTKLCEHLESTGEFTTFNVSYPSTRGDIPAHAAGLGRILRRLEGIEEIHLVGHSMGAILIRCHLQDGADPRIKRVVMLGPPNHGAELAEFAAKMRGTNWIAGGSVEMLGPKFRELEPRLATPACDFGILAGGTQGRGYNWLLPGDNDGMVTVESARLAGARDYRLLPVAHAFLPGDERVHRYTLEFLKHGHFETAEKRKPIEKVEVIGRREEKAEQK